MAAFYLEFLIGLLQELKHENIVTIIGEIHGQISLVMEYVRFGSLQGYLRMHKDALKPLTLLKFAEDVAKVGNLLNKPVRNRAVPSRNIPFLIMKTHCNLIGLL